MKLKTFKDIETSEEFKYYYDGFKLKSIDITDMDGISFNLKAKYQNDLIERLFTNNISLDFNYKGSQLEYIEVKGNIELFVPKKIRNRINLRNNNSYFIYYVYNQLSQISEVLIKSGGVIEGSVFFTYDNSGNIIKTVYDAGGHIDEEIFKYDNKFTPYFSNIIPCIFYFNKKNNNNIISWESTYHSYLISYSYNSSNRPTQMFISEDGGITKVLVSEFSYQ